jgi:ankyrin repeat protein
VKLPHPTMLKYLIDLQIDVDEPDYDGVTPFNALSKVNAGIAFFNETYNTLLLKDVRIDFPDLKGRTPFLNFYEQSDNIHAYKMLDLGANVNQMDTSGMFALKFALIRR